MIDRDKLGVTGFPKVHKRLDLADFAQHMRDQGVDEADASAVEDALSGNYLSVWLNHNQEFRDAWLDWNAAVEAGNRLVVELKAAGLQKEVDAALILSLTERLNKQNAITVALGREGEAALLGCETGDVEAIADLSNELYRWVTARAWEMVGEYRTGRKKGEAR